MKKTWLSVIILPVSVVLALMGCSLSAPRHYARVVIETYKPTGFGNTDTYVSLFGASGDPTLEVGAALWLPDPGAIVENDNGALYALIDYTAGLAPGTYYIRVRGATDTEAGPYAIRALIHLAIGDTYPAGSVFPGQNMADSPYEPDNLPTSGGIPSNPASLVDNVPLNRYLTVGGGDIDWFKLVLP